jgi:hypothetical protein
MRLNATDEEKKAVKKIMSGAKLLGINKTFNEILIGLRQIRKENDESLAQKGFKRVNNHDGVGEFHRVN